MFTTVAYYESVDPAGLAVSLNAVADQHVFVSGDDVRVPQEMPYLMGACGLINDASASRIQMVSPSLRTVINVDVEPVVAALVLGSPPEATLYPDTPVPLMPFEALQAQAVSDPSSAVVHQVLAWLSDGPQPEVRGRIYTIRATSAITLSAGVWVNGALTFSQTLPVGRYQIVGMRARGTNLVGARLVFVGGINRPGVPACNAIGDNDIYWQRHGRMGVFGEFHTNTPPTVDCLGVTDTAQVFLFDLLRIG